MAIQGNKIMNLEDGQVLYNDLRRRMEHGVLDLRIALNLLDEMIMDTTQTISFDSAGNVQSITHKQGNTTVRTDVFTFAANSITEVRTLATGESLTIVTNTDTLETTTTYTNAE